MSTTKSRVTGDAPIHAEEAGSIDWTRIFRLFLRALALLALARGLMQWGTICGLPNAEGLTFEDMAPAVQATIVFFAVIELVAGVGLWLAAAWGGVVWLLSVLVAIGLDAVAMGSTEGWVLAVARPRFATLGDAALIVFYLVATTAARRQAEHLDE